MAKKSKKQCNVPRCPNLTYTKYCKDHEYLLNKEKKGNTERFKLYNTIQWKRLRLRRLKENPLCVECEKKEIIEVATEVDHIKPHKNDSKLFFDYDNTQSLCKRCHSQKTRSELNNENSNE